MEKVKYSKKSEDDFDGIDWTIVHLSNSYISTLFVMSLGGREFDNPSLVHEFDFLRVKIHSTIEELFGMKRGEENKERRGELKRIFHSLNSHIGFPIPEHAGYGECTITRKELKDNFNELTKEYGMKLAKLLIETFGRYESGIWKNEG